MRLLINLVLAAVVATSLTGCVIAVNTADYDDDNQDWYERQEENSKAISQMALGRNRLSVENQMGDADFVDSFQRNGDVFVVLYYRTHRSDDDGKTTREETTPLVFVDDKLVGWGDSAVENATR